ncbi:hypothetical protein BATDEDRAFT_33865 [Batrachochytrium dendrobatidis JAM81]|uniref:PH domain-containing protein n=2 Tax=Batrachochytrium dendrobatidis TaxID=109871 RepID=F4NRB4_BATDJ|nr:uncharacterized protein BATDEDRAFT_33865 [Batrachochytrium dendrobatidis JAM81]EGF83724.1 hypothetical protein BATDEDRAFT_33865 [Batrachochytrium dendrobatidis JAM81]|eukprot:XP_006675674.1 hypothetical protein BATDEDRAFT_33865 [Batrachochytrium dendrobatidis JAM81]
MTSIPKASKYRNAYAAASGKSLYTNVRIDPVATNKIKASHHHLAIPDANATSIGILPLPATYVDDPIKVDMHAPHLLAHGKQIQDYAFSPLPDVSILATTTRSDSLIRLWTLPNTIPRMCAANQKPYENDMPDVFLAGHEKRVDWVRFHPTCPGIVISSSSDATVKIWSVEMLTDRITLTNPQELAAQSMAFDYECNSFISSTSDSMVHHYDPRSSSAPTYSFPTGLSPARGCRLSWLHPDPLVIATGFSLASKNERCIHVWDTRMMSTATLDSKQSTPLQVIQTDGLGVGIFDPVWDPALPLLYLTTRGEGIRIYELEGGMLLPTTTIKIDKHAAAIEPMFKDICDTRKCEIARFLRLGTDSAIEMTSIIVPRVNSDSVFQEDLFPSYATINPNALESQWFDDCISVEPILLDMPIALESNQEVVSASHETQSETSRSDISKTISHTSYSDTAVLLDKPFSHCKQKSEIHTHHRGISKSSMGSLRRPSSLKAPVSAQILKGHQRDSLGVFGRDSCTDRHAHSRGSSHDMTDSSLPPLPLLEGVLSLENKGWMSTAWKPVYFSVKSHRLYIGLDAAVDSPMHGFKFDEIQSVSAFSLTIQDSNSDVGLQVSLKNTTLFRFKALDKNERDKWLNVLQQHLDNATISTNASTIAAATKPQIPTISVSKTEENSPKPTKPRYPRADEQDTTGIAEQPRSQPTRHIQASHALLMGSLMYYTLSSTSRNAVSMWTPRLAVLDLDGTIHLFNDDVKAYSRGIKPIDIINLSTTLSVRVAKRDMDAAAVNGTGVISTSAQPTMFHLNTPNHAYHFQTKCARDAYDWVLHIGHVVKGMGYIPSSKIISNTIMEGYITIENITPDSSLAKDSKDQVNGALKSSEIKQLENGTYWVSLIHGSFYYFENELSNAPVTTYSPCTIYGYKLIGTVNSGTIPENSQEPVGFILDLGKEVGQLKHVIPEKQNQQSWTVFLEQSYRENYDLLGRFGIHTTEQLVSQLDTYQSTHGLTGFRPRLSTNAPVSKSLNSISVDQHPISDLTYTVIDQSLIGKAKQKTLIELSGKIRLTVVTVEPTWKSLSADNAYVLDVGDDVYHWGGDKSSRVCRAQALDVASRIRKSRGNRPRLVLIEKEERATWKAFLAHLHSNGEESVFNTQSQVQKRGSMGDLNTASTVGDVETPPLHIRVYCIDPFAALVSRQVLLMFDEQKYPSKSILATISLNNGCAVVHAENEVFVWSGKHSTNESRSLAAFIAHQVAVAQSSDGIHFVSMHLEAEDLETVIFKEKFSDFEGSIPISMRIDPVANPNIAHAITQQLADISMLLGPVPEEKKNVAEVLDVEGGGGHGSWSMYRIKQFTREQVTEPSLSGLFYRNESYVIVYTYRPKNSGVDKCVCYFWQGSASSITEKGTSALMTIELSLQAGLEVTQARIIEGKEPLHLFKIFKGIWIMIGTHVNPPLSSDSNIMVFDIRDVFDTVSKAIQIEPNEIVFNSNHVIVVLAGSVSYIWTGKHSSESERSKARETVTRFGSASTTVVTIDEKLGANSPEFTALLNHHGVTLPSQLVWNARTIPRLFSCSCASGTIQVSHVTNFIQTELDSNSAMILDAVTHIFVWFGHAAKPGEKVFALETATQYIEASTTHDRKRVLLAVTFEGQEPLEFIRQFHGWSKSKIAQGRSGLKPKSRPLADVLKEYKKETYSVQILLSKNVPEHLDRTKLEMYLSDDEFETLFRMKRDEYNALVTWKREGIKKQIGFY